MALPTDTDHFNYQRIEEAIHYLQQNFLRQPALDEIAENVHLSPFHFQRLFTEWAGISPKRFLQYLTATYLKERLGKSRNIDEAAADAGLSSSSRVYDLFTTLEAVTPGEYRERGAGISIRYGFHHTPFGMCLIGTTERGICWLSFGGVDAAATAVQELQTFWSNSSLREDIAGTRHYISEIFSRSATTKLHLFVKGTNFQVKVWEALLRIPPGNLTTYQDIARDIGNPKALQAVGSAVGSNIIGYLIPCHRVIRKDGILGEYRWTPARKKSMIGWEMAKYDS